MTDITQVATEIVESFERGAFQEPWERHVAGPIRKSWIGMQFWWPTIDGIGTTRRIAEVLQPFDGVARVVLSGERGEAAVTITFDADGRFTDLGVAELPLVLGIGGVQIDCATGTVPDVASLYAALLGWPVPVAPEPSWTVLMKDRATKPTLPLAGQVPEWRAPSWGDPSRQQQVHLELFSSDVSAVVSLALDHGATQVEDDVVVDASGHALRLRGGDSGDAPAVIGNVVMDCPDPSALASFYEELLDMRVRSVDTPDRVVLEGSPGLAFVRVEDHVPPRWPDVAYPQQMHMDIKFDDYLGAQQTALRLGATRLPDLDGLAHPSIYADPAGHPMCICFPGQ